MFDVVAIGEVLIDFTMCGTNEVGYPVLSAFPGGAPANLLTTISSFGGKTALISKVGTDLFGNMLIETLQNKGVCTKYIIKDDNVFTTMAFVTIDENGERSFSFARKPGSDTCLTLDEVDKEVIKQTKILCFGITPLTTEPAKTAVSQAVLLAKSLGKTIYFDPNYREYIWKNPEDARNQMLFGFEQADIVKISEEEVDFALGCSIDEACNTLLETYNVKMVFITLGKKGCLYCNQETKDFVPAIKEIKPIDTTGAGDIFGGSIIWEIIKNGEVELKLNPKQLKDSVNFACCSASLSTMKLGGITSIPSYKEVIEYLEINL